MNVVVAGGGTVAPIDDVRSIANISSGRFAAAITEACLARGASVWHIHTPAALLPFHRSASFDLDAADLAEEHRRLDRLVESWRAQRDRLRLVPLARGTVGEYARTLEQVLRAEPVDVVFLPIAATDYEPEPQTGKIESGLETLVIRCRRAPKVIRSVRGWAPSVYLAGFKLLSRVRVEDLVDAAERACRTNRADLTIANDLQTLREGRHTIHLVRPGQPPEILGPDPDLAAKLVDRVFGWAQARPLWS
jgi:phosphopantothenate-cysteine ligase